MLGSFGGGRSTWLFVTIHFIILGAAILFGTAFFDLYLSGSLSYNLYDGLKAGAEKALHGIGFHKATIENGQMVVSFILALVFILLDCVFLAPKIVNATVVACLVATCISFLGAFGAISFGKALLDRMENAGQTFDQIEHHKKQQKADYDRVLPPDQSGTSSTNETSETGDSPTPSDLPQDDQGTPTP
jgi:hypothetical protein